MARKGIPGSFAGFCPDNSAGIHQPCGELDGKRPTLMCAGGS